MEPKDKFQEYLQFLNKVFYVLAALALFGVSYLLYNIFV